MATLAVTNTLSNGATILASEHNTNYSDIVNYVNNRNSGSATWDALSAAHASNVPLVANNLTGTQDIFRAQDNGSNVFVVADGGVITAVNQSGARAYRNSSTQAISAATLTKVQFNAETYDTKSEFDSSTNYRFTNVVAGKYYVNSCITFGTASTCDILIYINGVAFSQMTYAPGVTNGTCIISDILSLSASDYIEIYVNSVDANTVVNGEDKSFVSIHKVA